MFLEAAGIHRYNVGIDTRTFVETSRGDVPFTKSFLAAFILLSVILRRRPPIPPWRLAASRPASVRAMISSICAKGRNCRMAISHALQLHASGFKVVLDADIKGFFDNLPHKVIFQAVRDHVADGKVLDLLERFLRCGVLEDGRLLATTKGTPQGGVISPLLANIVLNRLDWHLEQLGLRFVRYADDFVVLCQNRSQAEEARSQVETLLAQLGLSLSPQKTAITSYGKGYTFLGFVLSSRSRRIRPKSLEMFKDKVRALTVRKHNLDLVMVDHLNALLRGVAQYFCASFATNREQFHKLDSWVRMRLRAMKFKRKNSLDNYKLRIRTFQQSYRLFDLESFYVATHASLHRPLSRGSSSRSRPATETVTPVNLWN